MTLELDEKELSIVHAALMKLPMEIVEPVVYKVRMAAAPPQESPKDAEDGQA